jgi:L-gulonolactone oxidase
MAGLDRFMALDTATGIHRAEASVTLGEIMRGTACMDEGALGNINASFQNASFLIVLRALCTLQSPGLLSFPMEGATLALDFCNRGTQTLVLFEKLDAIVREAEVRLYAAKDGRIPRNMWATGYPELERFLAYADPNFSSDFWRRVQP